MTCTRTARTLTLLVFGLLAVTAVWALDALHDERVDSFYTESQLQLDHSRALTVVRSHDERSMGLLLAVSRDLDADGELTVEEFRRIMDEVLGEEVTR